LRRHLDWKKQADKDLRKAERDFTEGDYEWACFTSQQAAEKIVKATLYSFGKEARGHLIKNLLNELSVHIPVSEDLIECAKKLDFHYIPTRYPNAISRGAPFDFYTISMAQEAIENAKKIFVFCEKIFV
jgi:HEPN domain-containing protein